MLAHKSTGTRVRDGKHRIGQAGREQSQWEVQCTFAASLFPPLGKVTWTRKPLLKLQTTLPDCSCGPSQTSLHKHPWGATDIQQSISMDFNPTQATTSKCHSKGHGGQMVEETARGQSRGHQETPRADSIQGLADGIIWPSVTGSRACCP